MKRLPIAKTEIRQIVEENFLYVDKTWYIKELVDDGHEYYFLSRPRRFGKSLFVDTLRAAFEGEKELFAGLYLEHNWDWTVHYPVVKISFGGGTVTTVEELNLSIDYILDKNAKKYNVSLTKKSNSNRFDELIIALHTKFGQPVVILIDEYDKPILDNLTKDNVDGIREALSSFYSVLKDASEHIKLVFLTGVSRFTKTSIFSKLNNITDISLVPKYADICGITQNDLETVFVDYLQKHDLQEIKEWYDGYYFLGNYLYNPYDVLLFLWEGRFRCFWFETGTPTFLLELIKKQNFFVPDISCISISDFEMNEFDINNIKIDVLLFQTGYLTIKKMERIDDSYIYTLTIPNKEVRKGFNEYLLSAFYGAGINAYQRTAFSIQLRKSINDKNMELMKSTLISFFSGMAYSWYTNNDISKYEGFYCALFYTAFAAMGYEIRNEDTTNKGRIDFAFTTQGTIFIFEIKMKSNPKNALQQIRDKKYHEKYLSENKDIYLIGIEFDETERNISAFEWEKIDIK